MHNACLYRNTCYHPWCKNFGEGIPNVSLHLVGGSAFLRHLGLLKDYADDTKIHNKNMFIKNFEVIENASSVLKGRWRKTRNTGYLIWSIPPWYGSCYTRCVFPRNDPCEPRWRLDINQFKKIASLLTFCPMNRKCPWKETKTEKK